MKLNQLQRNEIIELLRLSNDKHSMCELFDTLHNYNVYAEYNREYIIVVNTELFEMYILLEKEETDVVNKMITAVRKYIYRFKVYNVYVNEKSYKILQQYSVMKGFFNSVVKYDVMSLKPIEYSGIAEIGCIEDTEDILDILLCEYGIKRDSSMYDNIMESVIRRVCSNSYRVLRRDGNIVSQLFINEDDNDIFIKGVLTPYAYRGNGYATELLKQVINTYFTLGKVMYIIVDQANTTAKQLYKKLGFTTKNNLYMYTIK